jgi:hypothetical protein
LNGIHEIPISLDMYFRLHADHDLSRSPVNSGNGQYADTDSPELAKLMSATTLSKLAAVRLDKDHIW